MSVRDDTVVREHAKSLGQSSSAFAEGEDNLRVKEGLLLDGELTEAARALSRRLRVCQNLPPELRLTIAFHCH